jgi:processive 1,2-diacylglycerol beta-glucosyltransferase
MKKKIIIAGASFGWGHMQAANNINKALSCLEQGWHIESINIFDYLPLGLKPVLSDGWRFASASKYFDRLYNEFYRYTVSRASTRRIVETLVKSTAQQIAQDFECSEISVFIATHSIAALIGSILKPQLKYKLCVAATDFVLHPMQTFPNVDFFYLPPRHRQFASANFGPECLEEKAQLTGIPIAPEFALRKDKEILRRLFGLSPNLCTTLVSFGGTGLRAERHINLFDSLLNYGLPLQFLVLAGQNRRFATLILNRYKNSKYRERIKVYNYLNDVSDFYAVADLFIGKAGGLTLSEALASGLPIIIIDALPGQEIFNMEVLSSNNVGHCTDNLTDLINLIKQLLLNDLASSVKSKLHGWARPHSSFDVAKHVIGLAM